MWVGVCSEGMDCPSSSSSGGSSSSVAVLPLAGKGEEAMFADGEMSPAIVLG